MVRAILLLMMIHLGCETEQRKDDTAVLDTVAIHSPQNIPERIALFREQPVLVATFDVSDSGYFLTTRKTMGVPTQTVDLNRDVLIVAKDSLGNDITSISVFNPRLISTVGSDKPARSTLVQATLNVHFAFPDSIYVVEVMVIRGPDADYRKSISIR